MMKILVKFILVTAFYISQNCHAGGNNTENTFPDLEYYGISNHQVILKISYTEQFYIPEYKKDTNFSLIGKQYLDVLTQCLPKKPSHIGVFCP